MRTALLSLGLMVLSCAHAKPEDATVAEHREKALEHEERAREQRALYDPNAPKVGKSQLARVDIDAPPGDLMQSYNPTEEHLAKADQELRERNAHLAAAKKLETFEDEACKGLSAGERSSCPLLASSVSKVQETKEGFKLVLKPGVDAEHTGKRLSCHLAYANATGFDRPSCPLFVKGTTLRVIKPDSVEFAGNSEAVALTLQAQARWVFKGVEPRVAR
ncbi:MAG: hypothetical protein JNG84_03705 [Archangium sp.]|nr:hypothetical protein [Archangium sp.]